MNRRASQKIGRGEPRPRVPSAKDGKNTDSVLRESYYDIRRPSSFGGVENIRRETNAKRTKIRVWLSEQDAYTLHRPVRKKFKRRKTFAPGIDHLHQLDLADMSTFARFNNGSRFILMVVDVFSKYCWLRPLKDKSAASVTDAYADILSTSLRRPVYVQSDLGKEFTNSMFQNYLRLNNITFYTRSNYDVKCAVVE